MLLAGRKRLPMPRAREKEALAARGAATPTAARTSAFIPFMVMALGLERATGWVKRVGRYRRQSVGTRERQVTSMSAGIRARRGPEFFLNLPTSGARFRVS